MVTLFSRSRSGYRRREAPGSSGWFRVRYFSWSTGTRRARGNLGKLGTPGVKCGSGGGAFMVLTIHGQLYRTNFYHNSFKCIYWISQFQIKPRKHVLSRLYRLLYFYAPLNIQNIHTGLQKIVLPLQFGQVHKASKKFIYFYFQNQPKYD